MDSLFDKCTFTRFNESCLKSVVKFECGDSDLDDFFTNDLFNHERQLLCKGYCFLSKEIPLKIVAAFTLSNDGLKGLPNSRKKKIESEIPREKHYSSYPAVMIGRLCVNIEMQGHSYGSQLLAFIKQWVLEYHYPSGCRFLLVDSYNNAENIHFYEKNGFRMMFSLEAQEKEYRRLSEDRELPTRLMYLDLVTVEN